MPYANELDRLEWQRINRPKYSEMSEDEKSKRRNRAKESYRKNKQRLNQKSRTRRIRLRNEIREKKAEQRFRFREMENRRLFKLSISSIYGLTIQSREWLENPIFVWECNGQRIREHLMDHLPSW